ncbi:MAG: sugar transferase, partial [Campylobacterales bacterium]|nr:sugar transferase [Campylobacterales bacterium]
VFDFFFSLFALILLSPVMIFIAIAIKIKSPNGPILFTQQRLGLNGKFFRVYKFRTMIPDAEAVLAKWLETHPEIRDEYLTYRKLKNDPRIIPIIGEFLRKTSLDEIPQFFNVLLGDMSVVGPRPYIANEFHNHSRQYVEVITSVKPGITGYWQVKTRNKSTFNQRVEMDMEYIKNQTFWLDLKIIFQTVLVMIFKKGAY